MMKKHWIASLFAIPLVSLGCATDALDENDLAAESEHEELGSTEQALTFNQYMAGYTNNATNSAYTSQLPVNIAAGETVMIGTTEITGSWSTGNTYLRLKNAGGVEVASNNDFCGGQGSLLSYKNTSTSSTSFTLWAGCSENSICGSPTQNKVAISRRADLFPYSASNTFFAMTGTTNREYYFDAGRTVRIGTCGHYAPGATATGDTVLRLYKQVGGEFITEVINNDNSPSAVGCNCSPASLIRYVIPSSGYYQVRAGCSGNLSCSGNVAVYVE